MSWQHCVWKLSHSRDTLHGIGWQELFIFKDKDNWSQLLLIADIHCDYMMENAFYLKLFIIISYKTKF